MIHTRRQLIVLACRTAGLATLASSGLARAEERLMEADPVAQALGYRDDVSKADMSRAKYQPGSACANCVLYQGKPGDATGDCPIFHKLVSANGWCNSYVKKAQG